MESIFHSRIPNRIRIWNSLLSNKKKGINLLFKKRILRGYDDDDDDDTAFQCACNKFGCEKVIEVIEDTRYTYSFFFFFFFGH